MLYEFAEGKRIEIIKTMENSKLDFEAPFKGHLPVDSLTVDF